MAITTIQEIEEQIKEIEEKLKKVKDAKMKEMLKKHIITKKTILRMAEQIS